jgi:hypothetical protein
MPDIIFDDDIPLGHVDTPTLPDMTQPFERVIVDYSIRGTGRVEWEMRRDFIDPLPWEFQLQVNQNGGEPTEWEDVGAAVEDIFYATDDTQRNFGKHLRVVYRVVCTTSRDTYTSENAQVLGALTRHQWLLANAITRRALLYPRSQRRFPGYLLKRRLHGTVCTCVDQFTGGITDSDCALCSGTGRIDGYWNAVENTMFDLSPAQLKDERDPQLTRGSINDETRMGRFVGLPQIANEDVWVEADSDKRYVITAVKNLAEIGTVPLIVAAELRLLPLTHIAYNYDVES